MLTGIAIVREPWGVSKIDSIDDPAYRGVLFIPRDRLVPMMRATVELDTQFTAQSVGDGAVLAEAAKLGVVVDVQPAWLHLDAATLAAHFGTGRMRDFQPPRRLFATINNACLLFWEDRIGSLEVGRQADFILIDRDLLTCPEGEIATTRALATYLADTLVFDWREGEEPKLG